MKRIKADRCGYISGYTCSPLPSLREELVTGSPSTIPLSRIPQHIEGFIMTLSPILDMDQTRNGEDASLYPLQPEVPELDCRVELDPFVYGTTVTTIRNNQVAYTANQNAATDGFLDLYNYVKDYNNKVYLKVNGSTHSVKADDYSFDADSVMGPGILEPMVDTDFSPITVDTIPAPDAAFDATTYLFDVFGAWRDLVDQRLNNIHAYVAPFDYSGIGGLINLEDARNQRGYCAFGQIQLEGNPTPIVIGDNLQVTPTYRISGGTIHVNGDIVEVDPVTELAPPFNAYLDVTTSSVAGVRYVANIRTTRQYPAQPGHLAYIDIGSVRAVTGSTTTPTPDAKGYTLYEIHQGSCIYDVVLPEKQEPLYKGPFYVQNTEGNSVTVVGFDSEDNQPKAGKIYIDGIFAGYAPFSSAISITANAAVYAHVDVDVSGTTPAYSDCTYDKQESTSTPATGHKIYTARLANCYTNGSNNVSTQQIHYGDIYIDTAAGTVLPAPGAYSGPFHLVPSTSSDVAGNTWSVYGVENGTAGRVYYNGVSIYNATVGAVTGNSTTNCYVYAHITVTENNTTIPATASVSRCDYSYSDTPATTASASQHIYTIRLAQTLGSTDYKQFHYGDIYLYSGKATDNGYHGPFRVEWSTTQVAGKLYVAIVGVDSDSSGGSTIYNAGFVCMYGELGNVEWVEQKTAVEVTNSDAVYLHAYLAICATDTKKYCIKSVDITGSSATTTLPTGATVDYVVRLARIDGENIEQTHFGDVYIDYQSIPDPQPTPPSEVAYRGPFKVTTTGVTCSICETNVVGYFRVNGGARQSVANDSVSVVTSDIAINGYKDIYVHVTGTATAVVNTTASYTSTPPAYTVWLGRINKDADGVLSAEQIHYGEVYVDGRWS